MAHTTAEFLNHLRAQAGFVKMQRVADGAGGLYIGPQMSSKDATALRRANVTHLLSVNGRPPMIQRVYPDLVVKVVDIEDAPDEDIQQHFRECHTFIEQGRKAGGVLVYCTAGISRSATVVVAHLMLRHGWSTDRALDVLRTSRRWVKPNAGFLAQLKEFEGRRAAGGTKCELCDLKRMTKWYDESHPQFVILQCDSCDLPMAVLRKHGMTPEPPQEVLRAMRRALAKAAECEFGADRKWFVDTVQRTIAGHR